MRRDDRFGAADVRCEDHGSIVLLRPMTDAGRLWVDLNILRGTEVQCWGGAVVVEPRYLAPILQGMQEEGLEVSA